MVVINEIFVQGFRTLFEKQHRKSDRIIKVDSSDQQKQGDFSYTFLGLTSSLESFAHVIGSLPLLILPVRLGKNHLFHFHQSGGRAAFILVQLHGDVFDGLLILRDHDMLKRIDAPPCLFDFGRHQLA